MYEVVMPPLHIKLGLFKQFVKAFDKNGQTFRYLSVRLPHFSPAKIAGGIFSGPDIRKMLKSEQCQNKLFFEYFFNVYVLFLIFSSLSKKKI